MFTRPTELSRRAFLKRLGIWSDDQPPDNTGSPNRSLPFEPLTPISQFYRQQLYGIPQLSAADWTLAISGRGSSLKLSLTDLLALPAASLPATLLCAGSHPNHPLIGTALWEGASLEQLLEMADTHGQYVHFIAADGYAVSLSRSQLFGAMLAYRMNGEPLPAGHGFPARLVVPGVYGYKQPKWIRRIEAADTPLSGHWEAQGWPADGEPLPMAAILHPHAADTLRGEITLAGIAYAGRRSLDRVEISIDDGDWQSVPFERYAQGCWSIWQSRWTPPAPGQYVARVRAFDEAGRASVPSAPAAFPGGLPDYPSVILRVAT